jgi:hypothetical protein
MSHGPAHDKNGRVFRGRFALPGLEPKATFWDQPKATEGEPQATFWGQPKATC